ncbi:MAG: hypothetical protein Q7S74_05495 [Nanoarchaeota archaeon]|nr:hypothetical protein [Nanoarchaeota archaeon]
MVMKAKKRKIKRFPKPSLSPQQADGVLRSASGRKSLIVKSDDVAKLRGIKPNLTINRRSHINKQKKPKKLSYAYIGRGILKAYPNEPLARFLCELYQNCWRGTNTEARFYIREIFNTSTLRELDKKFNLNLRYNEYDKFYTVRFNGLRNKLGDLADKMVLYKMRLDSEAYLLERGFLNNLSSQ